MLAFILSGCTTYKFQKATSGNQGYLACYDGYPIPEYTLGKEKSLPPDLTLAKERFKRRRSTVECYYKQMDQIESRLKAFLWEPPVMIAGFIGGVLRWPFIAVADYKYHHNLKYKAKIDKRDEEKEALETARVNNLRKELDAYIAADLTKEPLAQAVVRAVVTPKSQPEALSTTPESAKPALVLPVIPEVVPKTETSLANTQTASVSATPSAVTPEEPAVKSIEAPAVAAQPTAKIKPVVEEVPVAKIAPEPPVAVIIAKPVKGYSPLKVNFSGQKSHSQSGKIVSYLWDFGDGDISTKKNPENTYWSTTFGSRSFTVTLTVRDQAGSVSSATSTIEVITR
jgi:PKD domain